MIKLLDFFLLLCLGFLPISLVAQFTDTIQLPVVYPPQYRVYIDPAGIDQNSGDSLQPVATFLAALNKVDSLTNGLSGDIYAEVVFYPGTYDYAVEQPVNKYLLGAKRLNVSVRGKGMVILNGTGLTLNPGSAMIRLLGSNIRIKNFEISYSSANGVFCGFDYNGTVIDPNDIVIEGVKLDSVSGHGIKVGLGPIISSNPLALNPPAERFLIRNCTIKHSINFNDYSATQWGSCVKVHNSKYVTVANCLIHDNSGEGIGVDFSQYVDITNNVVYDNRANIYLDKADNCIIRNNLNYYTHRSETAILLSMEVFSALITNFYVRNVFIYNNVILNAESAISFWQGTVSALQKAHFININIHHNTIIGKRSGSGGVIRFSYLTFLGQPVANVYFYDLNLHGNIVSVHLDSLLNGTLVSGPLNPQPALTYGFNLWKKNPGIAYDSSLDRIDSLLPMHADPNDLSILIPHRDSNTALILATPSDSLVTYDYRFFSRYIDSTNAGAFEMDTTEVIDTATNISHTFADETINVFPNPFSNTTTIKTDALDFQAAGVQMFDVSGCEVKVEWIIRKNELIIQRGTLASGMYLLMIRSEATRTVLRLMVY